jgi:hypothetical protein
LKCDRDCVIFPTRRSRNQIATAVGVVRRVERLAVEVLAPLHAAIRRPVGAGTGGVAARARYS